MEIPLASFIDSTVARLRVASSWSGRAARRATLASLAPFCDLLATAAGSKCYNIHDFDWRGWCHVNDALMAWLSCQQESPRVPEPPIVDECEAWFTSNAVISEVEQLEEALHSHRRVAELPTDPAVCTSVYRDLYNRVLEAETSGLPDDSVTEEVEVLEQYAVRRIRQRLRC